jgi:hypothetical protein
MNSKNCRGVVALIYYKRGQHLSTDAEVFITVIAPASGIILGVGIKVIHGYIKRRRRRKLDSPKTIPSTGNNSNLFRRTFHRIRTTSAGRLTVLAYEKIMSSQFLRIAASSSFKVIDGIIIVRSGILAKDLVNYSIRNRENLFKVAVKTLGWIVYSRERDRMVNAAFILVTLITAKLWSTQNRTIQRCLRIWVFITLLNLSNYIYVYPNLLDLRPSDIGVFGLPIVEHPIKQFNSLLENGTNSKVSMIGKEETLVLPSSLPNEIPKSISNDVKLETNKIIQNSTLGEENIVLSKNEGLQKGKTRETHFTSKPKRRMNSLDKLNKTDETVKSLPIENDFETLSNSTKIKAEKVQ